MDPTQMMFPMWGAPPPAAMAMPPPSDDPASAPNAQPFLPPPNRGWKRKKPPAAYQPPTLGDLQVRNRAKARRWYNTNPNPNNPRKYFFPKNKNKAAAPRNTTSFIIRAKRSGGIAPFVSPCPPWIRFLEKTLDSAPRASAMDVYHSSFIDDDSITKACGCPLLPLKTHIKGPAPASNPDKADIIDEAITFFRANVFFKNFHVKSPADKLLIYLTFYINVALKRLEGCRTLAVGTKAIINLGLEKVPVPGEPGFPFPGLFTLPLSQEEAELLRNYLKQIREETSGRLLSCAYRANGFPNKWWLAFAKRKFMNIVIL